MTCDQGVRDLRDSVTRGDGVLVAADDDDPAGLLPVGGRGTAEDPPAGLAAPEEDVQCPATEPAEESVGGSPRCSEVSFIYIRPSLKS